MNTRVLGLSAVLAACAVATPTFAHEVAMNFNEVVHSADAIFVGRVASIECFETPALVGTRVTFDAISPITQRESAAPFINEQVVIEYAGGSLNGRGHDVCCQPTFQVGEEVLVMTQLDGGRYFSPFAGGRQGLFRLIRDEKGDSWPLTWSHRGLVPGHLSSLRQTDPVTHIHDSRPFYRDVPGTERVEAPVSMQGGIAVTLDGIRPAAVLSLSQLIDAIAIAAAGPTPHAIEDRAGRRTAFGPVATIKDRPPLEPIQAPALPPADRGSYCLCHYVDGYQNMQQVPTSWTNTWLDNNNAMACWNDLYELFVYNTSDGSWGNNSDSEFCGWPSDSEISGQYSTWTGWGTSTLAACVVEIWCGSCCKIREADIMFNDAFSWYYSLSSVIGTSGNRALYRPTAQHELGHAIGFETGDCGTENYQYNQPSAMAAGTSTFVVENGKGNHSLDAAGVRAHYASQSFEDVGTESYYASGGHISATLDPDSVLQGETFSVDGVTVENISSTAQADVRLRVYLSSNTTISESDTLVDEFTFSNMSKDSYWSGNLNNIAVPFSVDPDAYYVGLIVTIDGTSYNWDDYSANNATYVPELLTVGEGNPFDHWNFGPLLDFHYLNVAYYINNANSADDGGGECDGQPFMNGVWVRVIAPYSGLLRLLINGDDGEGFDGQPVCSSFIQVFPNIDGQPGDTIAQGCHTCLDPLELEVQQGAKFFIRIGSLGDAPVAGWLNAEILPPGPPGDEPEFAIPASFTQPTIDLTGYSATPLENTCSQEDTIDAWHVVIAPNFVGDFGLMQASTCNANTRIDTTLSVFTNLGQPITCNDDFTCSGNEAVGTSTVEWTAAPNQKFFVRVACSPNDTGSYSLTFAYDGPTPPGDDCDDPIPMQGNQQVFNTWGALDSGSVDCLGTLIGADLFMKWSAPADGWVRIGTCPDIGGSANFDSIVAVYENACEPSTLLACNDDAASDGTSIVELLVEQGHSYIIQVGSAASEATQHGGGMLAVESFTPDTPSCEGDVTGDGITGIDDLLALLDVWGSDDENADVAPDGGDGIVGIDDLLYIIKFWGCQ